MTTHLQGRWQVAATDRAAITASSRPAWVQFSDDGVRAYAGCNQMWASAALTATTITCSGVATTLMACEEDSMRAEYALAQFLSDADFRYWLEGDVLTLERDGETMQLQRTDIPADDTRTD